MAVASHLALLLVWYLFVKFGNVPKFVMPSPVDTAQDARSPATTTGGPTPRVTATEIFGGYCARARGRRAARARLHLVEAARGADDAAARQPQHDPEGRARAAHHRLVQVRNRAEHADRVLDLRLPDPADDRARPARGRARPARPGAHAARLALAGLHQDPAAGRAALHLLGHEGRRRSSPSPARSSASSSAPTKASAT